MLRDLSYAFRSLRREPRFFMIAVLLLAVGIGANSAMLGVIRNLLLAPLGFPQSDSIVVVNQRIPRLGGAVPFSSGNFLDLTQQTQALEKLAAIQRVNATLTERGDPAVLDIARVTPSYFDALTVRPILGRPLRPEDAIPADPSGMILGQGPLAILSHELWSTRFGADEQAIGSFAVLDGVAHEIVAVMPADFRPPGPADIWTPLLFGQVAPYDRGGFRLQVLARLKAGAGLEQARQEADAIALRLGKVVPAINDGLALEVNRLQEVLTGDIRPVLWILYGISALVLAVICANVGNLMLAKASSRQKEIGVRVALGAGGRSIVRQLLAESLLIAWAGGLIGALLAFVGLAALSGSLPSGFAAAATSGFSWMIPALCLAIATVSGAVFGLTSALWLLRPNLRELLVEGGRGLSANRRQRLLQDALVVAQLALSVVLLLSTALMVRSYWQLASLDLGFQPQRLVTLDLTLPQRNFSSSGSMIGFVDRAVEELHSIPGASTAAASLRLPVLDFGGGVWFHEGRARSQEDWSQGKVKSHSATFNVVTPAYFRTLGIPIVRGRGLGPQDRAGSAEVVVISQRLAERYFPDSDPVGRFLVLTAWRGVSRQIVGVVGDVRQGGLKADPAPAVYVPYRQLPFARLRFSVSMKGEAEAALTQARARIWSIDSGLGFESSGTMAQRLEAVRRPDRLALALVAAFGVIGMLLAAAGVYASTAYLVDLRRPEFGIRMALGGRSGHIVGNVLKGGSTRCLIGLSLGMGAGLAASQLSQRLLFEVSPLDPWAFAASMALMATAALMAMYLPARRAARIDPNTVLRCE